MTVLRTAAEQYVHAAAFDPLVFDLAADPDFTQDRAGQDPATRLAMAEALLTRITRLRDETLAGLPLPGS